MPMQKIIPPAISMTDQEDGQIRPELDARREIEQARLYCLSREMIEGVGTETDPFRIKSGLLGSTVSAFSGVYRLWELCREHEGKVLQVILPKRLLPVKFIICPFGVIAIPSGIGTAFVERMEEIEE